MEPGCFPYIILWSLSEVLKVVLIILEMRNWSLRESVDLPQSHTRCDWAGTCVHVFWLQTSSPVLHIGCHLSLTQERRLTISLNPERVLLSLYHTFAFDWVSSMPGAWLSRVLGLAVHLWAFDVLIPSLPWTCQVRTDWPWTLPLALSFSISRVGNDPNPNLRNCENDWFSCP